MRSRSWSALAVAGVLAATSVVTPAGAPRGAATAPFTVTPIAAQTVPAEQAPDASAIGRQPALLILMDVSSSMSEADPSGGSRISGAKDAVIDFVDTLPAEARVGLSTYPDDGGCGAGQAVIPVGPVDRTSMSARIRTLVPSGDTPTGAALQRAGQQLVASGSGPYAIVLVSDGESNCEGSSDPPCEVARRLGSQGVDVTVNTVGFQIGDVGRDELQCIADATAGTYVDAADGEELADAITTYSVPELSLEISHPTTVALQPGTSNEVRIEAVVTNTGAIPAPNVQATLAFDVRFSPGSAQPRHRLGNLAPGDAAVFGWAIRPTDEFVSQTVKFTARAYTRGFTTTPKPGEVRFDWSEDPTDVNGFGDGGTLVVMGDSYSSGEGAAEGLDLRADPDDASAEPPHPDAVGLGPTEEMGLDPDGRVYTTESDRGAPNRNRCHRAPRHTWGSHVARPRGMSLGLIACSGAKTSDFWYDSKTHNRPSGEDQPDQLEQLAEIRRAPTAVAMTIGGNDIGFSHIGAMCLVLGDCIVPAQAYFVRNLVSLPRKLRDVYWATMDVAEKRAGRSVPLFVLAYPRPFPGILSTCRGEVAATFSLAERVYLNSVVDALNGTIARTVRTLASEDQPISFVDTTATAMQPDHTVCASDQWLSFVSLAEESNFLGETNPISAFMQAVVHSFHPNHDGYAAMGRTFNAWLSENGSPQRGRDARTLASRPRDTDRTISATGGTVAASPGTSFWAEGDGFAPGSNVTVSLASDPEVVDLAVADEEGVVRAPVWVRQDFPIGAHHLVLEGVDAAGERVVLRRALDVRRPLPWGWWAGLGLAALAGLGAAGCWTALGVRRRRRRRGRAAT